MSKTDAFVAELNAASKPDLDKRLKKFGLKPLPKAQAVIFLTNIHLKLLRDKEMDREKKKEERKQAKAAESLDQSGVPASGFPSKTNSAPSRAKIAVKRKTSTEGEGAVVKQRKRADKPVVAPVPGPKIQDESVVILSADNSVVVIAEHKKQIPTTVSSCEELPVADQTVSVSRKVRLASSSEDESEPVTSKTSEEMVTKKKAATASETSKASSPTKKSSKSAKSLKKSEPKEDRKVQLLFSDESEAEAAPTIRPTKTKKISDPDQVRKVMTKYIRDRPKLHNQILLYETVYIKPFMVQLKEDGLDIKTESLMDFFDSQTICFSQHNAERPRQWGGKKKSAKSKSPRKSKSPTKAAPKPS